MGLSHINPWSIFLLLIIVIVLFGTKRLKNIGQDLGDAVKQFRKGMDESSAEKKTEDEKK